MCTKRDSRNFGDKFPHFCTPSYNLGNQCWLTQLPAIFKIMHFEVECGDNFHQSDIFKEFIDIFALLA